jgi:hypothetical protein
MLECIEIHDEPRGASIRWHEDRLADDLETLARTRIARHRVVERGPADDFAASLLPEGESAEDLVVEVELSEPLPPAFTPYQKSPRRAGELTFDEILEKMASFGPVRISGVHEAERWWAFGRWQIGSCGCAVERNDGRVTEFGSLYPWDDWLWAYDQGLVCAEPRDLVIESVVDMDAAIALLDSLRVPCTSDTRQRLARTQVVFERAVNWIAIPKLRQDSPRAFRWSVRSP